MIPLVVLAFTFPPPPPTATLTLRDADVATLASLVEFPAWLKPKLVGRVGLVVLVIRGDRFELKADHFRIPGDPIKSVVATGSLAAGTVKVRAEAFGGLAEFEGRVPSPR
jgi:hypothetical protein